MDTAARQRLGELLPLAQGDTVLDALAVAIAAEDTFGIVLADDDLTPAALCSPPALEATIERYLDGA